jgi:hypothetical protein
MLSVKQQELSQKKIIIYVVVMISMVSGAFYMYYNQFIKKPDIQNNQPELLIESRNISGQAVSTSTTGNLASTPKVEITPDKKEELEFFNDVINNPKFQALREIYTEGAFDVKFGKDNPFE